MQQSRGMSWPKRMIWLTAAFLLVVFLGMVAVRTYYELNLRPVSGSEESVLFVVESGATVDEIGTSLHEKGLIRSSAVFKWYVASKQVRDELQAGTYELKPNMTTPDIVSILTHGKIATNLVTILPGQRIDQIRQMLITNGFSEEDVDYALDPETHADHPVLADKPESASLEGYLYPESFQKNADTTAVEIVDASLDEMNKALTPAVRTAFAGHGLSIYQGITLASVVEREAPEQDTADDRKQVAQVFLSRLDIGMRLQSDPTAFYGSQLAGKGNSLTYDSPYNTYLYEGLPTGPISNVSSSSLQAVAFPAATDWLYFVAGDDGRTHFSRTLEEHERLTDQYCTTLCGN